MPKLQIFTLALGRWLKGRITLYNRKSLGGDPDPIGGRRCLSSNYMDTRSKKRLVWAILFSVVFTAVLLYRVEWDHFSSIVGRLDLKGIAAAYGVFLLGNVVRAFRFCKLDHTDNRLKHWWYISAFYNFLTATLPGGAGEAATAYVLKKFSRFNLFSALRMLLLSRVLDIFALSILFFISSVLVDKGTSYRDAAMWLSGGLFFVSSVMLLRSSERFIMRLLQKLPRNGKFMQKVSEKLSDLIELSEEQRRNNTFGVALFQSVLMWIGALILMHLVLRAFGIDFTLVQSAYCFGVYAVFQIVPVQGIAGIGTQAAWFALALNVAGYKPHDAIALGFVLHGTFYLFIASLGLLSMLLWMAGRGR